MTLTFIDCLPNDIPIAWTPTYPAWREVMVATHILMKKTPWVNDGRDQWGAKFDWKDCQHKVGAALTTLAMCGVPLYAMRGYVGGRLLAAQRKWYAHAILVIAIAGANGGLVVLDHEEDGLRSLAWCNGCGHYHSMKPGMKAEAIT